MKTGVSELGLQKFVDQTRKAMREYFPASPIACESVLLIFPVQSMPIWTKKNTVQWRLNQAHRQILPVQQQSHCHADTAFWLSQARMSVKAQDNAAQTPQVCQLYEYQREQLVSAIKSTNLGIAIILFNALVKQVPWYEFSDLWKDVLTLKHLIRFKSCKCKMNSLVNKNRVVINFQRCLTQH